MAPTTPETLDGDPELERLTATSGLVATIVGNGGSRTFSRQQGFEH